MAKGKRNGWSEWEELNLPSWLSRNEHLTWEQKKKRYFQEFGIPRSIQSIRGKINQEKQKSQSFSGGASANPHLTARKARRRRLRDLGSSSVHTLAFRSRASSTGSHQSSFDNTSQAETASDVSLDQYGQEFRLGHGVSGKTSTILRIPHKENCAHRKQFV